MFACFDEQGRLYVADSAGVNPPGGELAKSPPHRIVRLEDTRGDGRFDKASVFADRLTYPQGVWWQDGALFTASPPGLWRLEDTDGDGVADRRRELVTGWQLTGVADELHGPTAGPDGRLYWGCGRFPHEIRRPGGPLLRKGRAPLILRCRPDGRDVEVLSGAQGNPVKAAFSPEGEPLVCGTWGGNRRNRQDLIIHCVEGGDYPVLDGDFHEHKYTVGLLPPLTQLGVAAAAGALRYRDSAFGATYHDNLFSALYNLHKVKRHVLERDGATFRCRDEDFLASDRADFHPTDVLEDADGSLLVVDTGSWFSHCPTSRLGQSAVPGAIYRVRRRGAAPVADPRGLSLKWASLTPGDLALLLDDPRFAVRDRAVELLGRQGGGALAVLREVLRNGASVRARRNAVWALARRDETAARAAGRLALADRDQSVRLSAVTAVGLHRDAGALPRLLALLKADTPPVRREAATALGRLRQPAAVPALLEALRTGGDRFLDHALVYALIRIADREQTLRGLRDPSPLVRRGALVALDQMDGGNLTFEQVAPFLDPSEGVVREAALHVLEHRPGWARNMVGSLRRRLACDGLGKKGQEELRNQLLAFARDPDVQDLIARTLRAEKTPAATRLLLLEVITRAPLERLPTTWVAELRWSLEHPDERVVHQAVAALRGAGTADCDRALLAVAGDEARPEDLRLQALAAVGPRLSRVGPGTFTFLLACLGREKPPLLRLTAAGVLGQAHLDPGQLETLAQAVAGAGALELPRLLTAYENSRSAAVGNKLVAAVARSPGLPGLTPEGLRRALKPYPPAVQQQAAPLLKRLEADGSEQAARLADLEARLGPGDALRGQQIFFGGKAACATCHAVQGQGAHIGPDLTRIGAVRARRDLLESIVFPSASLARGYEPYVVTTQDGRFHTGLLARETADAIVLITAERAEIRLPRSAVETIEQGRVSIMPQGLDAQLTRQELADVLAFLQSLK
jgi:putative membrane-bound dehydrogenase-like protein